MKKCILILLSLFVCSLAFATNNQKIYSIDDDIVSDIKIIGRVSGYALPSSSGPWSGEELLDYLKGIENCCEPVKELYDSVVSRIEEDSRNGAFNPGLIVYLEGNVHTNTDDAFQTRDNWVRDFNQSKPMLTVTEDNHIGDNFYGYFELSLGVARHQCPGSAVFGETKLNSNILFLGNNNMSELDFNFPKRAFIAAGGDCFSFEIGRERLEWGNGTTGNLLLGDQIQYHNMIKASAWAENFKYTYLISGFPHPQNYYVNTDDYKGVKVYGDQSDYLNGISAFIAHRLEWTLWNRLNIALSEGIMYMSKDNKIDIASFMPSMLFHNNYTRSLSNSILGLDFDWTITKGLNVYGQVAIDEFALPGESAPGKGTRAAEPNGFGFLAGATYTLPVGTGFVSINAEGVYTDPYLYLRDGDLQSGTGENRGSNYNTGSEWRVQNKGEYGINYVVAVREMVAAGGAAYYDEQFLGYKYGSDAIVANLNASYDNKGLRASLNGFFMMHGTHDKWTIWTQVNNHYQNVTTPTSIHQTENQNDDNATANRTEVEKTLVIGASCSYDFDFGLSAFGQLDYVTIFNEGNMLKEPLKDIQFTFAVSYKL